jgi:hypothetical protein
MCVAIKENEYIATKYPDQRQDQGLLQSLCSSENKRKPKEVHRWSKVIPTRP